MAAVRMSIEREHIRTLAKAVMLLAMREPHEAYKLADEVFNANPLDYPKDEHGNARQLPVEER